MPVLTHAGPYRLLEHLATGGMGIVYLARHDRAAADAPPVAVKILRRGYDAEDRLRRFEAEHRLLAQLDHPNIARTIDAGLTADQRPYFVMEYVDGEPIDRYADRRQLSIRQRAALLGDVARAVDYLHGQLVVHRDLKPSNILVSSDGTVKLLDFGIAKLLDDDPDATSMTMDGVRLMTPGYASPEQMAGGRVTPATDVYVLGLLLFELLTGIRAQPTDDRSVAEIDTLIRETRLPRPSDVVTGGLYSDALAGARGTTPGRLRRLLRGDLDLIVGQAVRKEPERRYRSAQALADDLDRYDRNQPVAARGDGTAYRLGKFIRRHWMALVSMAVMMALLMAYAITVTVQTRQIRLERDRARAAQRKSEEVTSFLVRMFQASDPAELKGDELTARDLLAEGAARVGALAGQPDVQGQLLDVIGVVYQHLGKYDDAARLVAQALAVRRRALGEAHPDVADSLSHLGQIESLRGRYQDAEAHLRSALARRQALTRDGTFAANASMRGEDAATMLHTIETAIATDMHELGIVRLARGDLRQGKTWLEQALAARQRLLPAAHPELAESVSGLGFVASSLGDFAEMERQYRHALTLLRRSFDPVHPRIALGLNNLASALDSVGRYDESIALHREALAIRRKIYGDEHPSVATSLNNLAKVLIKRGADREALRHLRTTVALRTRLLGRDHPSTNLSQNNLAVVLYRSGHVAESERLLRQARASALRRVASSHPMVLTMDMHLAEVAGARGRYAEAERLFGQTIAARRETLGSAHPDVATALVAYGRYLARRGRRAAARSILTEAHDLRAAALGDDHPDTRMVATELTALRQPWTARRGHHAASTPR